METIQAIILGIVQGLTEFLPVSSSGHLQLAKELLGVDPEVGGLTFAYYAKPRHKATISYRDAFIIGLAQAVATLPGLSRSGTTIATGLILGNRKESVAQFSFLMVLAPILGKMVLDLMSGELAAQSIGTAPLLAGFAAAFVVGCLACKFMINIVKRGKLNWFAIYCTLVGGLAIIRYFVIQ